MVDHVLLLRSILGILSQDFSYYFCKLQRLPVFPQSFLGFRNTLVIEPETLYISPFNNFPVAMVVCVVFSKPNICLKKNL